MPLRVGLNSTVQVDRLAGVVFLPFLESVQYIVVDLSLLSPGVTGPGQVVGHVVGLHRRQDEQGSPQGCSLQKVDLLSNYHKMTMF